MQTDPRVREAAEAEAPLLSVEGAGIAFAARRGRRGVDVTRDVSFRIGRGERVGLVGESGCGKTVTGLSLMRLLPPDGEGRRGGSCSTGEDLLAASASADAADPRARASR